MKKLIAGFLLGFVFSKSFAALPAPTIADRGPHHRTWRTVTERTGPDGNVTRQTNSVVELGTGMHYRGQEGQWLESQEVIELLPGGTGAIARQGQIRVVFNPNINTAGAIDLSHEGKRFRSHVLGLAYVDAATGNSVMIAEIKDSVGQLVAPNQVIYPDAFTDFIADIRYQSRKGSFEQDVILRQKPPPPEAYGLSSQTARLQVWTEFIEAPAGTQKPVTLRQEKDAQRRLTMAEPDLVDHVLDFGQTRIGPGKAFLLEQMPGLQKNVPVGKLWATIEGRTFLVESVEYLSIKTFLDTLPAAAADQPAGKGNQQWAGLRGRKAVPRAEWAKALPKPPGPLLEKSKQSRIEVAAHQPISPGVVIDYPQLVTSTNNMVFKGGTTYYVSNAVSLSGTTVIEGGTVIKFGSAGIDQSGGSVVCLTSPYRPAILTSKDDNTVGETIPGSTGNPSVCLHESPFFCNYYFYLFALGGTELKHLHLRYAHMGIMFDFDAATNTLSHVQFVRGQYALYGDSTTIRLRNVLMHEIEKGLIGDYFTGVAEHLTINHCGKLADDYGTGNGVFSLTNCLLVYLTNWGISTITNTNAVVKIDDSSVFQTVGAASHYLSVNSPYRNAGTTNINPALLNEMRSKTAYPPIVIPAGEYTNSVVLYPQAPRNMDIPLGYCYDPIDFALGCVHFTNATVTVKPGTVLATFVPGAGERGMALLNGSKFFSEGSPTNLVRIVRYNTVQEQANTNWSAYKGPSILSSWHEGSPPPEARFRFTQWSTPANDIAHFHGWSGNMQEVSFIDCQFQGGLVNSDWPTLNMTNNLFERVYVSVVENNPMSATFFNNTFYGGTLDLYQDSGTWTFKNNLFDQTTILIQAGTCVDDYNAYVTNCTPVSTPTHSVILTNAPRYDWGPLGRYYFPTNDGMLSRLIDAGSASNAALVGLYHYTSTTNQVKEGNTTNNIGFHFVAVTNGVPIDTDGDLLADYFEDKDGDGTKDSDETKWTSTQGGDTPADTDEDGVSDYLEILQGRNPLANGTVADTNGIMNLRIYTPLK